MKGRATILFLLGLLPTVGYALRWPALEEVGRALTASPASARAVDLSFKVQLEWRDREGQLQARNLDEAIFKGLAGPAARQRPSAGRPSP